MGKTLTIYFSAGGTTKRAAERLAAAIGSELYEIRPAVPYTRADLDWQDARSRSSVEMDDPASRPAFIDDGFDAAPYERIFLGFPIWWYTAPRIVQSFLESRDFSGKTIVLFATSGSSGLGRTAADLAPSCPGAVIKDGRMFRGSISEAELRRWAEAM